MFKKLKQKVPFNRLGLYLLVLGQLPIFCALLHYVQKKNEWDAVSEKILSVQQLAANNARKQSLNTTVRKVYEKADQFYLENQLETLTFLKKEKETLEQLLKGPTFTGNEAAEKRFVFLTSALNRLEWTPANIQTAENIQQTDMHLSHPVEVDVQDLKEILMRIEGNRKGKPQLIITDFRLNKKELLGGNEVFELNMKLLKRDFH